ncbi:uncharacterized protein V6R79_005399 [Siganus canaliculatus]
MCCGSSPAARKRQLSTDERPQAAATKPPPPPESHFNRSMMASEHLKRKHNTRAALQDAASPESQRCTGRGGKTAGKD